MLDRWFYNNSLSKLVFCLEGKRMLLPLLFMGTPKDLSNNTKYFIKKTLNFKQSLPQKFISKSEHSITVSIRQIIAWLKLYFSSKMLCKQKGVMDLL